MENDNLTRYFSASMGKGERLITWVVACGAGMGLPPCSLKLLIDPLQICDRFAVG
jgi:hypothetical protein